MKTMEFKKVTKTDAEHVECVLSSGKKIRRMFRKHTKAVRKLRESGVYCFEIQGVLYYYHFDENNNGMEFAPPQEFRSSKRKLSEPVRGRESMKGNGVSITIPEMPTKASQGLTEVSEKKGSSEIRHKQYETIKTCIENDIPVYLTGPAGSGKNFTLEQISWDLGFEFYFTNSVQQEYKLTGFIDAGGTYHETEFYKAFTRGGIFFLDEMDSSIPEVLVLLNAAIANRYFEFPNGRVAAHKDFRVVAAGNTVGSGADEVYTGRMVLDMATLDRFVIIDFDYDENVELYLSGGNKALVEFVHDLRKDAEEHGIRATFSYRCITMVTKLEKAGMNLKQILSIAVFKGMDKDTVNSFNLRPVNRYSSVLKSIQRAA